MARRVRRPPAPDVGSTTGRRTPRAQDTMSSGMVNYQARRWFIDEMRRHGVPTWEAVLQYRYEKDHYPNEAPSVRRSLDRLEAS